MVRAEVQGQGALPDPAAQEDDRLEDLVTADLLRLDLMDKVALAEPVGWVAGTGDLDSGRLVAVVGMQRTLRLGKGRKVSMCLPMVRRFGQRTHMMAMFQSSMFPPSLWLKP